MKDIIKQFNKYNIFYIFGHSDPDGDCIGSQLGLGKFLQRIGKKVKFFSDGRFGRSEIKKFENLFEKQFSPFPDENDDAVAVILDCSTPERTGDVFTAHIAKYKTIIIDHHSSGSNFGDFRYVDPSAPSVTILIFKCIQAMGYELTKEEAELLFLGLCTDTAFFHHLTETGYEAFNIAAEFVKAGASPNKIYFDINGNRKLASRYLIAKMLERVVPYFDGKLLITYETLADYETIPYEYRDIDTIYSLLQGTEKTEVIAAVKEENETEISVGLRTRGSIDLGAVAKSFGGGGHKKASGFRVTMPRDEVVRRIVEAFRSMLE